MMEVIYWFLVLLLGFAIGSIVAISILFLIDV